MSSIPIDATPRFRKSLNLHTMPLIKLLCSSTEFHNLIAFETKLRKSVKHFFKLPLLLLLV